MNISSSHHMKISIQFTLIFLLLFSFATILYCHDQGVLKGEWLLDDKGTITMNPVVLGAVPFEEIWTRDFWGHHHLADENSHKSWRPLCTATFYWNRIWAGGVSASDGHTYYFHIFDRILHGLVTAVAFPVAMQCFLHHKRRWMASFLTALLFAVHPIHAEAVANSTGRAEVLCALFYFGGFVMYTCSRSFSDWTLLGSLIGTAVALLFTFASMLSKEHGITMPIMCIVWDAYIGTNTYVLELFSSRHRTNRDWGEKRKHQCRFFLLRVFSLITGTIIMIKWRLAKNGDSAPNFVCEQNPIACEPVRIYRFLHISYLWSVNFWLMAYPFELSPDWSGDSIPILGMNWATDPRFACVLLLWYALCIFILETIKSTTDINRGKRFGSDAAKDLTSQMKSEENSRRITIISVFWLLVPFLMSSNLFVYVGFVIAERTLYLPSFGSCLLLINFLLHWMENASVTHSIRRKITSVVVICLLFTSYTLKQQAQTQRWSSAVLLWKDAYRVNPDSCISGKEYGAALVNENRNVEAIEVLERVHRTSLARSFFTRTIANARGHGNDFSNKIGERLGKIERMSDILVTRFKLVTAMGNAGKCYQARTLIDEGLAIVNNIEKDLNALRKVDEKMNGSTFEELMTTTLNNKAYLNVAKSRCSEFLSGMMAYALEAVQIRPGIEYVLNHAKSVNDIAQRVTDAGLNPRQVKLVWNLKQGSQTADFSLAKM